MPGTNRLASFRIKAVSIIFVRLVRRYSKEAVPWLILLDIRTRLEIEDLFFSLLEEANYKLEDFRVGYFPFDRIIAV